MLERPPHLSQFHVRAIPFENLRGPIDNFADTTISVPNSFLQTPPPTFFFANAPPPTHFYFLSPVHPPEDLKWNSP